MKKQFIILFVALMIAIILVNIQFFNNGIKANSDYMLELHKVDSDGDHLPDYIEQELGTDPYNEDSDFDKIIDIDEVYLGTSPVLWDTDNDKMADGYEIGTRHGSTSPFEKDTDHDGLPDPWEDNDGDQLLNREEQLWIHDGLCIFMSPFADNPAATSPNDADTDNDGWNDGDEVQVNSTYSGPGAVSTPPPVDRLNSDLDIAVPTSWASQYLSGRGWDSATFADWRNGLILAGSYNLLPSQCTKISWYHFSPYYIWEQLTELGQITDNFTTWLPQQNFGVLDRGSPYDWNLYDCDPTLNDTDGDVMDDNWDPDPLVINLRNGTFAAINSIRRAGFPIINVTQPKETTWDYFGTNISVLELGKGDIVEINVSVGLQQCNPLNISHVNFIQGKYTPVRVVFRFRPIGLGPNGTPHNDDDELDAANVARLTRTFVNVNQSFMVPGMTERNFTNHLGIDSTITFFYQTFQIRIPSAVPAGHIAITVETDCENNFYYFPSNPFLVY
jgi:hypothetical protein